MDGLEGTVVAAASNNSGLWLSILSIVLAPLTGIVGWLFGTLLTVKKTAENNNTRLDIVEKNLAEYNALPAQVASLKATQEANFAEVLRSLNRLEAHTIRAQVTPPTSP